MILLSKSYTISSYYLYSLRFCFPNLTLFFLHCFSSYTRFASSFAQNWKTEFGWLDANLAGINAPASLSTCVPKPKAQTTTPNSIYDRTKCELCGSDFWCARNEQFPGAVFLDPLRSNVEDPIRGRVITKMKIKAYGSMKIDDRILVSDQTSAHLLANTKRHDYVLPPGGEQNYWNCNECVSFDEDFFPLC